MIMKQLKGFQGDYLSLFAGLLIRRVSKPPFQLTHYRELPNLFDQLPGLFHIA